MKNILKKYTLYPERLDLKAILISYILINIIYLYHTLNFMWGNHDVLFVKEQLLLSSGMFEGRFSQFILPYFLTNGQILPIITNLLGFAFLVLGLWLLAKYWQIPKSILNYTLFITFFASLPYTLSWLYFTLYTISCLSWITFIVLGLYLSEHIQKSKNKLWLIIISVICFYLPLGGYPPVINTIFVCLGAKITISYVFEKKDIKTLLHIYKYTLLNIFLAAILLKLTLLIIKPDNVYNLGLTPLTEIPTKLIATLGYTLKQFTLALPFMEKSYKILLLILTLFGIFSTIISKSNAKRIVITLLLICGTIYSSSLTTLLVIPPTQYVARIDFYGVAFVYTFALALLLLSKTPIVKSIGTILVFILILCNTINDYRAQKIWYQGFNAEMQILDDIIERIENHPAFNTKKQYRFYQAGDITLRPAYYQQKFEQNEPFLLALPYLAMWQGARLAEFYSPFAYINHEAAILPQDITPKVYDFILKKARPYPHKNAVYIDENIIIIIYNQYGLDDLKEKIRMLYSQNS